MTGTDDIVARLLLHAERADSPIAHETATALAERDATIERLEERCAAYKGQVEAGAAEIERLTAERDSATSELNRIRDAVAAKGGNEHAPTEWAYQAACDAWRKRIELHRAAEARTTAAERERDEARAEVERLACSVVSYAEDGRHIAEAERFGRDLGADAYERRDGRFDTMVQLARTALKARAALTAKGGENGEG